MSNNDRYCLNCPYCRSELSPVHTDPLSDWGGCSLWICMNDCCSFFTNSWNILGDQGAGMGYRYYYDEANQNEGSILVASADTYKDRVVDFMVPKCESTTLGFSPHTEITNELEILNRVRGMEIQLDKVVRKLDQIVMFFKSDPDRLRK